MFYEVAELFYEIFFYFLIFVFMSALSCTQSCICSLYRFHFLLRQVSFLFSGFRVDRVAAAFTTHNRNPNKQIHFTNLQF